MSVVTNVFITIGVFMQVLIKYENSERFELVNIGEEYERGGW